MDFNQIRYFLELSECLNFTNAAERCNVSQPGLTAAIRKLEQELGGALIVRDGRNTRLTELGRTLRRSFEGITRLKDEIHATAQMFNAGKTDEINIGLMCTIGPRVLSQFLDAFQEENPRATLVLHDVTPNSIGALLKSDALDIAYCGRNGPPVSGLTYERLFDEDMVVAFSPDHPFEAMDTVTLDEVGHERYLDRLHCEFREFFLAEFNERRLALDVAFLSEREDWIQDMIAAGVGVSILPRFSLMRPRILTRPLCEPNLSRAIEVVTMTGRPHSGIVQKLLDKTAQYDWSVLERKLTDAVEKT